MTSKRKYAHWTQDPANKHKLKQIAKKAHAARAANAAARKSKTKGTQDGSQLDDAQVSYIFGRVEAQIESYAKGLGVAPEALTQRVGNLLRRSSSR